ncbi:GumC family protein [Hymenobacter sp. DG25A]|uniref:GumC family protein n=1 Tax=Hymenobacter sp. DG25A TaxID=1385663 RepID=UPI0008FFA8E9|nr:tyrosine-protein kinase [Hymenobacter sp. DG25A]
MDPQAASDGIDLHQLLFRIRTRWPLVVGCLLVAFIGAFLYLQVKTPIYDFKSTMMLGSQTSGSKQAQELLKLLEIRDKSVKMEDEIGMITSLAMVQKTMKRLPHFTTSYFVVPDTWVNAAFPLKKRELAMESSPFRITPLPNTPQLVDVPIRIDILPDGRYQVRADADKGELKNLQTGAVLRRVANVHINETVSAGHELKHPLLSVRIDPNQVVEGGEKGQYFVKLQDMMSVVVNQLQGLSARAIDHESHIIQLMASGPVPKQQQQFLDTLMSVMLADEVQDKNRVGQRTLDFLDGEIAKMAALRQQASQDLSAFRTSRGVVNVDAQSSNRVSQLTNLQLERSRVATQRKYYQNMLSYLRSNRSLNQVVSPASMGISDPVLNQMVLQLAELSSQKAALGVNASADNPMVTVLDERIKSTREALNQTLSNLLRTSDIGLNDLESQVNQVRGDLNRLPEDERRLAMLQSKSDFNDKNYNFLLEKRTEAAIALATNSTDKKIVDHALMQGNGPSSPKPMFVGLIALLSGLIVPIGILLVTQKVNRRIQSKEDLARVTDIPLLGVVAHASKADKQQMVHEPKGLVAESFRSIRVNLQYLSGGLEKKLIGVTSSVPGEGKSFCAVNLAAELAHSGRRVILVETDLRQPTMATYFAMPPSDKGLATYLSGLTSFEDSVRPSGVELLDVMTCGIIPPNATQLLETPRMAELLERLRAEYDYIVLDTPPVGYVAEYFVLMRFLDANIYVVRQNYTDLSLLSQINDLHLEQKIKNVFLIINDVHFAKTYEYRHRTKAYSYGYSH